MKWNDIPDKVKKWTGAFLGLAAVGALIIGWVSYLHPDAEAAAHIEEFYSYQTAYSTILYCPAPSGPSQLLPFYPRAS